MPSLGGHQHFEDGTVSAPGIPRAVGRVAVRGTTRKLPAKRESILGGKTPSTSPGSHSAVLKLIHFNWKFLEKWLASFRIFTDSENSPVDNLLSQLKNEAFILPRLSGVI